MQKVVGVTHTLLVERMKRMKGKIVKWIILVSNQFPFNYRWIPWDFFRCPRWLTDTGTEHWRVEALSFAEDQMTEGEGRGGGELNYYCNEIWTNLLRAQFIMKELLLITWTTCAITSASLHRPRKRWKQGVGSISSSSGEQSKEELWLGLEQIPIVEHFQILEKKKKRGNWSSCRFREQLNVTTDLKIRIKEKGDQVDAVDE